MKIKNQNHYTDEQLEIVQEIIRKMERLTGECEKTFHDEIDIESKAKILEYKQTQMAVLADLVDNTFRYEVIDNDGMRYTQKLFNKAFYYREAAEIELAKHTRVSD